MNRRWALAAAVLVAGAGSGTTMPVGAQGLGTFRWQLQPYCNILTLSVRQDGAVYTLDGFDDQCGAASAASALGTAFPNPDGSIGFGVSGAAAPGAAPVMLYARLSPSTVSGTWSDSAGNAGTFAFTPGPGTGGAPRPVPTNGIRPGSITSGQLAPGAVGTAEIALGSITAAQIALGSITGSQIAAGSITGAQVATGTITAQHLAPGTAQGPIGMCPVGQYLRGVTAGSPICEPFFTPTLSTTVDDPANQVGSYTSIAIGTDGLPVISHRDVTAQALRVTKCGNPACTAGNVSTTVDDPANAVGFYTSIAIGQDGFPVISHLDETARGLRVTHCGNAACTAGNVSTTVDDPADEVGYYTSIALGTDGLPVISHQQVNATDSTLRVTHCGNVDCTSGNVSTTVDDPAELVGLFTSIAIGADGLPVISHMDFTNRALRVTHCGNAACTAGNVSTTVDDPAEEVGYDSALAIGADGFPVISHHEATADALRVTHCGNAACTAGNVSTNVDDPVNVVGGHTSIAIGADGLPVISHADLTANALRVTRCGNPACTAGTVSTTVDDPANTVGRDTDIAVGPNGLPVISHRDFTAGALRVTRCGTGSCR